MVVIVVMIVITASGDDDAAAQCTPQGDSQQDQRENSFHDDALPLRVIELY